MERTNLLTLVITLTLGVILSGSILMPVITDAQTNLGNATIINNENITPTADYTLNDFTMTLTAANDGDGYAVYVNDVGFEKPSRSKVALISDFLLVHASSESGRSAEIRYWDVENSVEYSPNVNDPITITYTHNDHKLTYVVGSTTIIFENTSFVFVWDENGQYGEVISYSDYPSKAFRMESINDQSWGVFEYAGSFTVGEETHRGLITQTKYGIESYFAEDPNWTVTLEYGTPTLKDGTTDLYDGLEPKFVITDEDGNTAEYQPYRSFVLNEANGHQTAGAAYFLLGAIPIMVIIALIMVAVGVVARRND